MHRHHTCLFNMACHKELNKEGSSKKIAKLLPDYSRLGRHEQVLIYFDNNT